MSKEKEKFSSSNKLNPYKALPQMSLFTYQMPEELLSIATGGEFDEFDLNTFLKLKEMTKIRSLCTKASSKMFDIIRGIDFPKTNEFLESGTMPPFPYSDVRLLPYLQHSLWFMPNISSCNAMKIY